MGIGVDEAEHDMDECEMVVAVIRGKIIECQAGEERRVVDNRNDSSFSLQVNVLFVDLLLFGTIVDSIRGIEER